MASYPEETRRLGAVSSQASHQRMTGAVAASSALWCSNCRKLALAQDRKFFVAAWI